MDSFFSTPSRRIKLPCCDPRPPIALRAPFPRLKKFSIKRSVCPGAIYIECHDEEIMRGREETALSATVVADGAGGEGWFGARS